MGNKVNRKLKSARTLINASQQDIANYLGISKRAYCSKENGKNDFTETEINKILELFLNKTYEDIFLD